MLVNRLDEEMPAGPWGVDEAVNDAAGGPVQGYDAGRPSNW